MNEVVMTRLFLPVREAPASGQIMDIAPAMRLAITLFTGCANSCAPLSLVVATIMSRLAVLLLDIQIDFLDGEIGRMPVPPNDAERVIQNANAILSGSVVRSALPVFIVNQFPVADHVLNFFRHGAAISGTSGAAIDGRIATQPQVRVFPKSRPSAFSNAELEPFLRENAIDVVCVMGVFAEGCVRATALDAKSWGFGVVVCENAIATNSTLKMAFALWALRRGGVTIVPTLSAVEKAT